MELASSEKSALDNARQFVYNVDMKKLLCFLMALCFVPVTAIALSETPQTPETLQTSPVELSYTMVTTNDPERYTEFTAQGDTITARGVYKGDVVANFVVMPYDGEDKRTLEPEPDGSYTASFTGVPDGDTAFIYVVLENGGTMEYLANYNHELDFDNGGGWYFDGRGIAQQHIDIVQGYTETADAVTRQYLAGENASVQEVTAVLSQISALALEITAGFNDNYAKARAISHWVAENIYYDTLARENDVSLETIALVNVLETRKTTCAGYANLTAALLHSVGLKSITVIGQTIYLTANEYEQLPDVQNRHHEWTAFWLPDGAKDETGEPGTTGGRWVMLDAGWDSWNTYGGEYNTAKAPKRYFDITPLAFSQNHRPEKAEYRNWSVEDFTLVPPDYYTDATPSRASNLDDILPLLITMFAIALSAVAITVAIILHRQNRKNRGR